MTTDSVSALRGLFDAWNRGDLASGHSALDEYVVWDARNSLVPDLRTVFFGVAGVTEFWSQWLPMWKRLTVEPCWIEGYGERARAWVHQVQVGHESGVELTWDYGWDVTFRDGKIIRVSFFTEESRAFGESHGGPAGHAGKSQPK